VTIFYSVHATSKVNNLHTSTSGSVWNPEYPAESLIRECSILQNAAMHEVNSCWGEECGDEARLLHANGPDLPTMEIPAAASFPYSFHQSRIRTQGQWARS
jgi:hypothetical protein